MKDSEETSSRPVKCFYCKKQMYYHGDKNWVPEVTININEEYHRTITHYTHKKCVPKEMLIKE